VPFPGGRFADDDGSAPQIPSSSSVSPCAAIADQRHIVSIVTAYDGIGTTYSRTRRPDPRIAGHIHAALGEAATVINIGAGTGSYEPPQTVLAVEPSSVMIAQRPAGSAPALQASAESIPLADDSADAVMALLTVHHWTDVEAGIAELLRIARRRVVIFTWDQAIFRRFWLVEEYLPEAAAFDDTRAVAIDRLIALLGGAHIEAVPVPHDCTDGFGAAFWRRPAAYLDPGVRSGISMLAQTGEDALRPGLARLAEDLSSGLWSERNADLLDRETLDVGYRLLVADL
jgi:SAM-dependent methyltransferase